MKIFGGLRNIVLANKVLDVNRDNEAYYKKQILKVLGTDLDVLSVINDLKKSKKIFLNKIRKIDKENLSAEEIEHKKNSMIFDYIENIFSKFGFNDIKLHSLYYNFNKENINEFISLFSRGLNNEELYEEKRSLIKNTCLLDKNKIHLPIYDILFKDGVIGYITADIAGYDKQKIFFLANIIFNLLSDIIHSIFINKYENLINLSLIDSMTGAFFREYGLKKIKESLKQLPENFDIDFMFVDIDHFKRFNDTYGHKMGDKVLSIFVKAILNSIRKTDYIVRYGGEEFVIVFTNVIGDETMIFERIKYNIDQNLKNLVKEYNIPENITFSGGVAKASSVFNADINKKIEDIIVIADKNMYEAKDNGRNQIVLQNGKVIKG